MIQLDIAAITNQMRYRARSGEVDGNSATFDLKYVKKCSTRAGMTTLVFTRDVGNHSCGWLSEPTHERCLHLSIAPSSAVERSAWLHAFFGDNLEMVWGEASHSHDHERVVSHWRLFCDSHWHPIADDPHPDDLLTAGLIRARDLGIFAADSRVAA